MSEIQGKDPSQCVHIVNSTYPWRRHDILIAFMIFSLGLFVGHVIGYLSARSSRVFEGATDRLAVAPSKPLAFQVSVTNSAPSPPGGKLFDLLADLTATAIGTVGQSATEQAKLPSVAAAKFIESLSGGVGSETGKKLVDGISELISSGFQPSSDKAKDRQKLIEFFVQNTVRVIDPGAIVVPRPPRTEARIVFDIGQARLTPSANATIHSVRDFAVANPGTVILLTANADTLGLERRNLNLARQRSMVVRERLVSAGGIAANRVFVTDLGNASLPIVTPRNTSEEQNRSVSIEVR